ncbi:DUF4298 domain-containing protein [Streptococcus parauberis]|uniref:DUF4298 domain-containing protein n=1 Tax=Streptococcus parauberis TaxID=1348 RepID=UPI00020CBBCB|nr:DUF4298 domain-containing protein [Streptococcus parauberis]AEF26254.1 hypothetical protein STP_1806 [Streptococcus parauberis KCTC 11537]QBX09802.1 hypothetical protein JavanS388_0013 [Streptococcus satellite phage Javan388]QBX10027.1 hypothetical protein JavanS404_0006 [Streptococcus satellite phage Javan404]QBX10130.1 hypothetical protein JavanS412_0006 [Streptococcus satellite phage Javan412]ONH63075.1 hypothetical protein ASN87_01540 [Streptococcus parauberis]
MDQQNLIILEDNYKKFQKTQDNLFQALTEYKNSYSDFKEITKFYGSDEWFNLHENKINNPDLEILGEDTIYDLIISHTDLLGEMLELSTQMYKTI